jgi:hypothetical protein
MIESAGDKRVASGSRRNNGLQALAFQSQGNDALELRHMFFLK